MISLESDVFSLFLKEIEFGLVTRPILITLSVVFKVIEFGLALLRSRCSPLGSLGALLEPT